MMPTLRRVAAQVIAFALLAASAACVDKILGADPSSSPASLFDMVWTDFDRNYATFDLRRVDWSDAYRRYKPQADSARGTDEVAAVVGAMFRELHDPHVDLTVGSRKVYSSVDFLSMHTWWNAPATIARYVPQSTLTASRNIRYGRVAPDIGWISISTFVGSGWSGEIDEALAALDGVSAIIIDVRNNGGGNTSNSDPIAGRFVDAERVYSYMEYRNGPAHDDFTPLRAITVTPQGRRFMGRVVALTNRKCASATESFLLALRSDPSIQLVGDTTMGALSDPLVREMANGWTYRLPQGNRLDANKVRLETIGVAPDVYVRMTYSDSVAGRDPQLDRAIALLRQ